MHPPKFPLICLFLLAILAALWPAAAPAAADQGPMISAVNAPAGAQPIARSGSLLEIGPVVEQERIGQHESLHLLGAIAATGSFDLCPHANARWILTQPFTEGRLKTIRPRLQAGVFLRF